MVEAPGDAGRNSPVPKPADAFFQVTPGLIFGVDDDLDVDLGQAQGDEVAEVLGELIIVPEGVITPLT